MSQEVSRSASWLELSRDALLANIATFRTVAGVTGQPVGVVLKANAYGHGLPQVLSVVHDKVDVLYVITAGDALYIRKFEKEKRLPKKRVLVMGYVTTAEVLALAEEDVEVTVADASWAENVVALRTAAVGKKVQVHIHIDTGLGREGFLPNSLEKEAGFLAAAADVVEVKGLFSHFANTEDVTEQSYAFEQLAAFEEGFSKLAAILPAKVERHFAASAATLVLPQSRYDIVRVGIGLYGLWPSSETRLSAKIVLSQLPQLTPVLRWRCRSQLVKVLPAGSFVGYGCTMRCAEATRIAVFPVGYFDGYPRLLSSKAHVLVNGHRCPVLGRVMMNHIVVDITRASADDSAVVATLLGQDGKEVVSAETFASWAQTINYEIVARLGEHLERIVV